MLLLSGVCWCQMASRWRQPVLTYQSANRFCTMTMPMPDVHTSWFHRSVLLTPSRVQPTPRPIHTSTSSIQCRSTSCTATVWCYPAIVWLRGAHRTTTATAMCLRVGRCISASAWWPPSVPSKETTSAGLRLAWHRAIRIVYVRPTCPMMPTCCLIDQSTGLFTRMSVLSRTLEMSLAFP